MIRATLALLILVAAPAAAQPAGRQAHSIISATWVSSRHVDYPDCPEPAICAGEIADVRFSEVETLAGRRVPEALTVRLQSLLGQGVGDNRRAVLVVRWDGDGRPWAGRWLGSALPNEETCIRSGWFSMLGLRPPRHSRARGDETCFPA